MFLWRITPKSILEIMLNLLKCAKDTQQLNQSNASTTIKTIFESKRSIFVFFNQVQKILSQSQLVLTQFRTKILDQLTIIYNKCRITTQPIIELERYAKMLNVVIHDWRECRTITDVLVCDEDICT